MQSFLTIEVTSLLGYNTRHGKLTASSLVCKVLDADHTSGEPHLQDIVSEHMQCRHLLLVSRDINSWRS